MSERADHVDPNKLRENLLRLAEFIREMDRQGQLLTAGPRLLKMMGDLRSELFHYEVRHTGRLLPKEPTAQAQTEPPAERESRRVVEDALRRQRELEKEWRRGCSPEDGGE